MGRYSIEGEGGEEGEEEEGEAEAVKEVSIDTDGHIYWIQVYKLNFP